MAQCHLDAHVSDPPTEYLCTGHRSVNAMVADKIDSRMRLRPILQELLDIGLKCLECFGMDVNEPILRSRVSAVVPIFSAFEMRDIEVFVSVGQTT